MTKMIIEILGGGCSKCHSLENNARNALSQAGLEGEVKLITDMKQILARGVTFTPGLLVNGEIVSTGRVLTSKQIIKLLEKHK